jgi:hypothetical protein
MWQQRACSRDLERGGSDNTSFVAFQYVDAPGATSGVGDQFTIPAGTDTSVQYEIRYFLNDTYTLAAKSAAFNVQQLPTILCGTGFSGSNVPTAHLVSVNRTAGTVSFNYDSAATYRDRFLVYSGGTLLFDSGCVLGSYTIPLTFSSNNSQVRVVTMPNCTGTSGTSFNWRVSCAY